MFNKQTLVTVQYELEFSANKLTSIACGGCLATNNNIEELIEAIRHTNLAIQQLLENE